MLLELFGVGGGRKHSINAIGWKVLNNFLSQLSNSSTNAQEA